MLKTLIEKTDKQIIFLSVCAFLICCSLSLKAQTITWTGDVNANWKNSANWFPNSIPDTNNNVIIPQGLINYPVISGGAFAASVTIDAGASLKINGNVTLTISNAGSFNKNGSFSAGTGIVKFAGSGTVSGSVKFNNLTVNGAVDAGNACTIKSVLKINANGSIINHTVTYSDTSTLIYNNGTFITTGKEWLQGNDSAGKGIPQNITITNATSVALQGNRSLPGTLQVSANSMLSLNDHTLILNGIIKGNGVIKGSQQSGLIVNGSGAFGKIYFDKTTDGITNALNNITINRNAGTVTIGNKLNVIGTYTPAAGVLTTNDTIVFKSFSTGTARVAEGSSAGGYINGIVQTERFIPARRAWRFLTAPVKNDTLHIRTAWQEGVNNSSLGSSNNLNPQPGYGTHISGNNDAVLGFDYNTNANASLKTWEQSTISWSAAAPPTASTLINSYPAYLVFVRGSRAVDLSQGSSAPPDSTRLRATGFLNMGDITKTLSGNANELLYLGNPYISSIDLTKTLNDAQNISGKIKFWLWDPKISSNGGYVAYNNGSSTDAVSYTNANAAKILQSGGAFLIQISQPSASVTFHESDKTERDFNVFGKGASKAELHVNLTQAGSDGLILADATTVQFNSKYSAAVDDFDAAKLYNFNENIVLIRNEKALAIELRPVPQNNDTLFYRLYLRQNIPYTLHVYSQNLPSVMKDAWLIDKYLNTQTKLNFNDSLLYNFTPNSDTSSYRNRFMIVFEPPSLKEKSGSFSLAKKAKESSGISIYPNPVKGNKIQLQFENMSKGGYDMFVYNAKGQIILNKKIEHDAETHFYNIPVNTLLTDGVYTLSVIKTGSKQKITIQFIVAE